MESTVAFAALHRFLCAGGSIDVGRIDVWRYAAVACDADSVRVVLDRRQGESLHELLQRLDSALDESLRSGSVIDEIGRREHFPRADTAHSISRRVGQP